METKPVILDLPEEVNAILKDELSFLDSDYINYEGLRRFLSVVLQIVTRHLPIDWLMLMEDVRSNRINPPYILLRGMPVDDVSSIPTPTDGFLSRLKVTVLAEAIQLAICQLIGIPFCFANERRNAGIIHLIAGRPGQQNALTSESSSLGLGYHVEQAFSRFLCPTWVTLICLRSDPEQTAVTGMVDIRDLIGHISNEALKILQLPIYVFKVPDSFGVIGGLSDPMPIIEGTIEKPQFRISLENKIMVVDKDPEKVAAGYNAIGELTNLMNRTDLSHQVKLMKGDLLLMSNRTTAHCRTSFQFHDHLINRWLHRVIVTSSLYEAREMQTKELNQYA